MHPSSPAKKKHNHLPNTCSLLFVEFMKLFAFFDSRPIFPASAKEQNMNDHLAQTTLNNSAMKLKKIAGFFVFRSQIREKAHRIGAMIKYQGGGGSFKNRKPIAEVGCCDSGMAERSH
jgi:hypothetical protein